MPTSTLTVDPKTWGNDCKMSKLGLCLYSWGEKKKAAKTYVSLGGQNKLLQSE